MSSATYLLLMSAGLKQGVTVVAVWLRRRAARAAARRRAARASGFWLPAALAAAGFVVLFAVGSTVAFDSEHPKFTSIYYRVGARAARPSGRASDPVDDYTRPFLGERPRAPMLPEYFPQLGSRTMAVGAAPRSACGRRRSSVLSDVTVGDRRTVRVRVRSRAARRC